MATANIVADFDTWQAELFATLVKATKASNAIPAGDVSFYRTLDRSFASDMNEASSATLDLCNKLLQQAGGSWTDQLKDSEDVNDRFDIAVDVVDNLLEKVDIAIDDMKSTRKKGGSTVAQSAPIVASAKLNKNDRLEYKLIHAQNIARPQLRFPDPVDNSYAPFVRKIRYKPNAKVDLNYGMEHAHGDSGSEELVAQPHPYEYEINHLEYPQRMFLHTPEQLYSTFSTTTPIWVDTEEALVDMCRTLEMQQEIAIDLEHHNYRSFQGFVCLMQISTRDQDFLVDTLELRGSLHLLNQSFTDPNIVKVLHGAESDIVWLQQDFGVYIVNMFDTYHASKLLELGSYSLAHLLKLYADFETDKRYQLADWRIRPLPHEMMIYAQADTHFLLYIYDRMRNALLEKSNPTTHNLLHASLKRSADTCLNRYQKEAYDAEGGDGSLGWRNLYSKWSGSFNNTQFAVYKALHAWRDQTARDEDESVRYVLPNNMLFTMADRMPEEASKVLACCNPVPPIVRMNATDIALLIISTKANVAPMLGKVRIAETDDSTKPDPTARDGAHASSNPASKATPLEKAEQAQGGSKVVAAQSSRMFGGSGHNSQSGLSPVAIKAMANPSKLIAARSGLFGDSSSQTKPSKAEEEGKKIAQQIIVDLSTQQSATPVFKEVILKAGRVTAVETTTVTTTTTTTTTTATTTESTVAGADQEEMVFVPKDERATKPKRTDVLVLSTMSKKRSRAIDEDRAELENEAKEDMSGNEDSPIVVDEEAAGEGVEGSGDVVKVKKNKKNKKRKQGEAGTGSSTSSAAATPSSSAAASGGEEPDAFKPFDYNSVRSVVDEVMDNAGSGRKKNKKKKGAAGSSSEAPAPFDPYSKLEEQSDLKKKDPTFTRHPKSGSRSMTFSKN